MASPPIRLRRFWNCGDFWILCRPPKPGVRTRVWFRRLTQLKQLLHKFEPADCPRKQKNRTRSFQLFNNIAR
jgi:hypothetical protein